jgi:HD superfamily phosphohydrolase
VTRLIESCGVRTLATGETSICFEEKMAMDLLGLFRTRMQLHSHLYQHHVVNVSFESIRACFIFFLRARSFHLAIFLGGARRCSHR